MPEISILLPSLRPEAVSRNVDEFSLTNQEVDYEIVAVSPFKVEGQRVIHIFEEKRQGVIRAMNEAYKGASGEFIVIWSDDALPERHCLSHMLEFVKKHEIPFIGSFRKRDKERKELEQWSVYNKLYGSWCCASRETVDAVGGLFDPSFKNYWADPDLSLRVWKKRGGVAVCQNAWIKVEQIDDEVKAGNLNSSFNADTWVFLNRWHAELGNSSQTSWTDINLPVPHSPSGQVRAMLRKVPYLRTIKHLALNLVKRSK